MFARNTRFLVVAFAILVWGVSAGFASENENEEEFKIEGEVTAINHDKDTFSVGSLTFRITHHTDFRGSDANHDDKNNELPTWFEVGVRVEVEYRPADEGPPIAKKVKLFSDDEHEEEDPEEVEVEGRIAEIDVDLMALVVGDTFVQVTGTTEIFSHHKDRLEFGDLEVEDYVKVRGTELPEGGVLAATILRKEREDEQDECDEKKYRGWVTEIDHENDILVVDLLTFRITGDTEFEIEDEGHPEEHDKSNSENRASGELGDLQVGDAVKVEYCANGNEGLPIALEVERLNEHPREIKIEGRIQEIDLDLFALIVNDTYVQVTGATKIRGEGEGKIEFEDLEVEDFVQIHGRPLPEGGVLARTIHRKKRHAECESKIQGLVHAVGIESGTIAVGIVEVWVDANTEILDASGEEIGLADVPLGVCVKVKFCNRIGAPIALRIRVKNDDDFDLNDDGEVEYGDLLEFLSHRRRGGVTVDFNGNAHSDGHDLFFFQSKWGTRGSSR